MHSWKNDINCVVWNLGGRQITKRKKSWHIPLSVFERILECNCIVLKQTYWQNKDKNTIKHMIVTSTELNLITVYLLQQHKWWVKFHVGPVLPLFQAVVYEKPGFEGSCLEIDHDVFSFCENEGGFSAEEANFDSKNLMSVGSLKIVRGLWVFALLMHCLLPLPQHLIKGVDFVRGRVLQPSSATSLHLFLCSWVGYSEPGFEGQQHILEEGEYVDCSDWGGSEHLISLRPILAVSTILA